MFFFFRLNYFVDTNFTPRVRKMSVKAVQATITMTVLTMVVHQTDGRAKSTVQSTMQTNGHYFLTRGRDNI